VKIGDPACWFHRDDGGSQGRSEAVIEKAARNLISHYRHQGIDGTVFQSGSVSGGGSGIFSSGELLERHGAHLRGLLKKYFYVKLR